MKLYWIGLIVTLVVLIPILTFMLQIPDLKPYLDLSVFSVGMFILMSIILYLILRRSVLRQNHRLFLSVTMVNLLAKMVLTIVILLVYQLVAHTADTKFVWPFLVIYVSFTIFETWFMSDMARKKP